MPTLSQFSWAIILNVRGEETHIPSLHIHIIEKLKWDLPFACAKCLFMGKHITCELLACDRGCLLNDFEINQFDDMYGLR